MCNRFIPLLLLTAVVTGPLLAAGCSLPPHQPSTGEYSQD